MTNLRKRMFTPLMIEKVGVPDRGRIEIADAYCPGLLLRVSDNGYKSFSVIYRVAGEGGINKRGTPIGGKQHRITLGRWPLLTLQEARKQAMEVRITASTGHDPRFLRRNSIAIQTENTVESVLKRFIERQAKSGNVNWKNIQSLLERTLIPGWGVRAINKVTRADAHALLDEVAMNKGAKMAGEVRKHAGRLFSWALDREIVTANPFVRMDRPEDEKYKPRERCLTDKELALVWEASKQLGYPYGTCVQLLILTGLRRDNLGAAKWEWLDKETNLLVVPKEHFKSRYIHEVPLSGLAREIVVALPRYENNSFLFTGRIGGKAINGWSDRKGKLDSVISELNQGNEIPSWTIHDLRHTVKTGLSRLGISSDIKDRILGHAKTGMDAVYDHYTYRNEKCAALELWAEHIQKIIASEPPSPTKTLLK